MKAQREKKLEFFCAQALGFVLFYEKETHRYVLQWGFCLQSMPISLNDSIICHRESHAKFFSLRVSNYFFVIRAACANCLSFRTWVEHSRDERVKIANPIQLWEFDRKGEKILSITFSESLDFSVVDRLNKRRLVTRRLLWNGTIEILGLKSETKARLYTRRHCMVTSTLRRWNAKTQLFFHFYGLAYCAQYETRFRNAFFETRCGKRVFRKRSSNQRNLKTPALRRFSVEGKHFANG